MKSQFIQDMLVKKEHRLRELGGLMHSQYLQRGWPSKLVEAHKFWSQADEIEKVREKYDQDCHMFEALLKSSDADDLPRKLKFDGPMLVASDESLVVGTFHNVQGAGRRDYRAAILGRLNR